MVFGFGGKSAPSTPTKSAERPANAQLEPLAAPPANYAVAERAALSAEQQSKVDRLIQHLEQEDYALPTQLKDLKPYYKLKSKQSPSSAIPAHVREATASSTVTMQDDSGLQPLSELEKFYLSGERTFLYLIMQGYSRSSGTELQRCLRAVRWDLQKAILRVEETIVWRRDFGVETLAASDVAEEVRDNAEDLECVI